VTRIDNKTENNKRGQQQYRPARRTEKNKRGPRPTRGDSEEGREQQEGTVKRAENNEKGQ
jgi:hypothetical protein